MTLQGGGLPPAAPRRRPAIRTDERYIAKPIVGRDDLGAPSYATDLPTENAHGPNRGVSVSRDW